ncbi:MAG: hypothetical protein E7504_01080 [Ruminococcus sp.]|nr:hypothetical protein [Ruminococcus sp.]
MDKNPVKNVLNGFYKNAAVGVDSINNLMDKVSDSSLRQELSDQRDYYESQKMELTAQMAQVYQQPVEQGTLAKLCSDMTIKMHSIGGLTVQEAAKLMVEGTNMGMVQLHQVLNRNPNIPDDLKKQGKKILKREQEYLDRITPYL